MEFTLTTAYSAGLALIALFFLDFASRLILGRAASHRTRLLERLQQHVGGSIEWKFGLLNRHAQARALQFRQDIIGGELECRVEFVTGLIEPDLRRRSRTRVEVRAPWGLPPGLCIDPEKIARGDEVRLGSIDLMSGIKDLCVGLEPPEWPRLVVTGRTAAIEFPWLMGPSELPLIQNSLLMLQLAVGAAVEV